MRNLMGRLLVASGVMVVALIMGNVSVLADVTAIAIGARSSDPDDLAAGWATAATNEAAIKEAVEYCQKDGGKDCKVLSNMTFQNCGAVSADDKMKVFMNVERTRREAEEASLKSCGNSSCHVVISRCH